MRFHFRQTDNIDNIVNHTIYMFAISMGHGWRGLFVYQKVI